MNQQHYIEAEEALRAKVSEITGIDMPSQFVKDRKPIMKKFTPEEILNMQAKTYAWYCACAQLPSLSCSEKRIALAFIAAKVKTQLYNQYRYHGKEFIDKLNEFVPTEDEVLAILN